MSDQKPLPVLNAEELRVLGVLMEKARTTPEYYPMTVNGIVAACNQKTSRKPVVNYDEQGVIITLDTLRKKGLVSTATGAGSRVTKYKHNLAIVYPLVPADLAVICLLLLRGPLTPGEINNMSGRLYGFESIDEVQDVLNALASTEPPFLFQIVKKPGQKEARYAHLLGGDVVEVDAEGDLDLASANSAALEDRIRAVEEQIAVLREAIDKFKDLL